MFSPHQVTSKLMVGDWFCTSYRRADGAHLPHSVPQGCRVLRGLWSAFIVAAARNRAGARRRPAQAGQIACDAMQKTRSMSQGGCVVALPTELQRHMSHSRGGGVPPPLCEGGKRSGGSGFPHFYCSTKDSPKSANINQAAPCFWLPPQKTPSASTQPSSGCMG